MAEIRVTKDNRLRKDGTSQVVLRCGEKKFGTGIYCTDLIGGSIIGPHSLTKNRVMSEALYKIEELMLQGVRFKDACQRAFKGEPSYTILNMIAEYVEVNVKSAGTRSIYDELSKKVEAFGDAGIGEVNVRWLKDFERSMDGLKVNTKGKHLRSLRAVMNYCRHMRYTDNYPFASFRIAAEQTEPRDLLPEELIRLKEFPCEPYQQKYVDVFMLMIYLCGIAPVDLFSLTKENIIDGRIVFHRRKTNIRASLSMPPEAAAIFRKYKGKKHLLCFADTTDHISWFHSMGDALKRVGPMYIKGRGGKKNIKPLFPRISPYWARNTFASIAHEDCGVARDVIAHAMGQVDRTVTDRYIRRREKLVDDCQQRVIAFIHETEKGPAHHE